MTALLTTGVEFPDSTVQTTAAPDDIIIMWWGNILDIPEGWALCDTDPILEDRFVVGAGDLYAVGSTGGAVSHTLTAPQLPSHAHPVSSSIAPAGSHSHGASVSASSNHAHPYSPSGVLRLSPGTPFGPGPGRVQAISVGSTPNHSHSATNLDANAVHAHSASLSLSTSGVGDAHNNMPPYYALVFLKAI